MFGNEDTKLYRVLMFDELEEYESVIERLTSAAERGDGIALSNRGLARAEIGEADEALVDFTAAIAAIPRASVPRMNRGNLLEKLDRSDEALIDYGAAVELEPQDPYYRRTRAHLLHHLGRFAEAIADYDVAIEIEPDLRRTRDDRDRARDKLPVTS
ncbi:MAG: tetratricopeptide repeat protein [Deltaproteobacteria bacterium]|nr:tetratricopeptide repeat protein [Deltaproteobacteria bacterium]